MKVTSKKEKKEKHIWKTMWILIYFLVIIVLYRNKSYVKALKFKEEYLPNWERREMN